MVSLYEIHMHFIRDGAKRGKKQRQLRPFVHIVLNPTVVIINHHLNKRLFTFSYHSSVENHTSVVLSD